MTGKMNALHLARAESDQAQAAWLDACKAHGFADEFAAYKAEQDEPWPFKLALAHARYMSKLHAFYVLRDGPRGVLGGRGL